MCSVFGLRKNHGFSQIIVGFLRFEVKMAKFQSLSTRVSEASAVSKLRCQVVKSVRKVLLCEK